MAELLPPNINPGFDRDAQVPPQGENRGEATVNTREAAPISVTLKQIDEAVILFLREQIKPTVVDNGKQVIVPVLYGSAERWKQIRKDGAIRDEAQRAQTPLILIKRTGVTRSKHTSPVNRHLEHTFQTGWNRHNAYDKFAVLNGQTPSRQLVSVKMPDYVSLAYDVLIWTDYVEQMNEVIEQINYQTDEYWGTRNNFKFHVGVESYKTDTDLGQAGDRYVRTTFQMAVDAYLLPEAQFDIDKGVTSTTQQRFTPKKIVNLIELDGTGPVS